MKNVTFIFSDNSNPAFQKGLHDRPVFTDDCRFAMEGSLKDKTFIFNYDDIDGINVRNILEYLESIDSPTSHFKYNFLQFVGFMKHSDEHFMNIYAIMHVQTKNELKVKVILPRNLVLPDYPYDGPQSSRKSKFEARKEVLTKLDCLKLDLASTMRLHVDNIELHVYPKLPSSLVFDKEPIHKTEYFQPKPDLEQHKHNTGEINMQTQPNYNQIPQLFGTDNNTLICVELDFPKVNVMANQIFNDLINSNFSADVFKSSHFVGINLAMEFGGILANIKKTLLHDMKYQSIVIILPATPQGVLLDAFKYVYAHLGFVFIEKPRCASAVNDLMVETHTESFKLIGAVNLLHPAGGYHPIGGNQHPWQQQARAVVNNGVNLDNVSCACGMLKGIHKHGAICPTCSTKVLPTNI